MGLKGLACDVLWPRLRTWCRKLVAHTAWTAIVVALIGGSTVVLCLDSARLEQQTSDEALRTRSTLRELNYAFAILFTIEMVIQMVAMGLGRYFTDGWSLLDFVIVVISWVALYATGISAFKSLRTLRCLRPLRVISRLPSMQLVIEALIRSVPSIANVTLVLLVFWLVFAILGVQVLLAYRLTQDHSLVHEPTGLHLLTCFLLSLAYLRPRACFALT